MWCRRPAVAGTAGLLMARWSWFPPALIPVCDSDGRGDLSLGQEAYRRWLPCQSSAPRAALPAVGRLGGGVSRCGESPLLVISWSSPACPSLADDRSRRWSTVRRVCRNSGGDGTGPPRRRTLDADLDGAVLAMTVCDNACCDIPSFTDISFQEISERAQRRAHHARLGRAGGGRHNVSSYRAAGRPCGVCPSRARNQ
jgi:hypothetical protein